MIHDVELRIAVTTLMIGWFVTIGFSITYFYGRINRLMADVALLKDYSEAKINLLSAKLDMERARINRLMAVIGIDKYEEDQN